MKPLQPIALGFVVIALVAPLGGYDVLADPVGWVLVLAGLTRVPVPPRRAGPLRIWALMALVVSVALWFPTVKDALAETHDSFTWAVNLPQLVLSVLLCVALAETAREPDPPARGWLRTTAVLLVVVAALPVLVGAGLTGLEQVSYVGSAAVLLLLICLLFIYSGRAWAKVESS